VRTANGDPAGVKAKVLGILVLKRLLMTLERPKPNFEKY
jgi:hypothetical protein